jgi:hypothetical protein
MAVQAGEIWFVLLFSVSRLLLNFEGESILGLRANQWVLVALFAEGLGAFYVRGGGRKNPTDGGGERTSMQSFPRRLAELKHLEEEKSGARPYCTAHGSGSLF